MSDRHICQVAFSATNAARLREWYRAVFGMARGSGALFTMPPMPPDRQSGSA